MIETFTIIDESDDVLSLIKKIMKGAKFGVKEYYIPRAIKNKISGAKNELLDAEGFSKVLRELLDDEDVVEDI